MYELELSRKAEEPLHHHSIKSLAGELQGSLRMRIGDIRIVYSIDETTKTVFVEVIGFRGDVYK